MLGQTLELHKLAALAPGPMGAGRRRLVAEFAHDAADRYPGGVFWLDRAISVPREMASDVSVRLSGPYLNWPFQTANESISVMWRMLAASPKSLLIIVGSSPGEATFFMGKPPTVDLIVGWSRAAPGLGLEVPLIEPADIATALAPNQSALVALGLSIENIADRLRGDALTVDLLQGLCELDTSLWATNLDMNTLKAFDEREPLVSVAIDALDAHSRSALALFAALAPRPVPLEWIDVFFAEANDSGASDAPLDRQSLDALLSCRLIATNALGHLEMHPRIWQHVVSRERSAERSWAGPVVVRGLCRLEKVFGANSTLQRLVSPHIRHLRTKELSVPPAQIGKVMSIGAQVDGWRGFDPVPSARAALAAYRRAEPEGPGELSYRGALLLGHVLERRDPVEARKIADEALSIAERHWGRSSRQVVEALDALARVVGAGVCGPATDEQLELEERALRILEALNDTPRPVLAERTAWLSLSRAGAGQVEAGLDGLRRAVNMVRGLDPAIERRILGLLVVALVDERRFDEAIEVMVASTQLARVSRRARSFVGNTLAPLVQSDVGTERALRLLAIVDEVLAWPEWERDLAGEPGVESNGLAGEADSRSHMRDAERSLLRVRAQRTVLLIWLDRVDEARAAAELALGEGLPSQVRLLELLRGIVAGSVTADTLRASARPPTVATSGK